MNKIQFKTIMEEDMSSRIPLKRVYDLAYKSLDNKFYITAQDDLVEIRDAGTSVLKSVRWTGNPLENRKAFIDNIFEILRFYNLIEEGYNWKVVEVDLYVLPAEVK